MSKTEYYDLSAPFILESGKYLDKVRVAYNTYGSLNSRRDNVIVVCHALSANSQVDDWWHGLYGEGRLFDPSKYFIICANNLGSPYGTTSPKSINPGTGERYGINFPFFTLRDTADLYKALLEFLEIEDIQLVVGGSCGGNIAMESKYSIPV